MTKRFIYLLLFGSNMLFTQTAVWPFDSQNAAHPIQKNMGDYVSWAGFHNAVDVQAAVGDTAKAVITGVVRYYAPNPYPDSLYNGVIDVCSLVTDTNDFWRYAHLYDIDTTYKMALRDSTLATPIPTTDFYLGRVCDWPDSAGGSDDHLHLLKQWEVVNIEHPLNFLAPSPASTPVIDTVIYRKDQSPDTMYNLSQFAPSGYVWVYDSVDIIARAHTILEGNANSGIEKIWYSISDVAGNTVVPAYILLNFDNLCAFESEDTIIRDLVYAKGYRAWWNYATAWANPYIVTNRDTFYVLVGALSNVMENCWPTKIDIAGIADADSIEDAKFPDGAYVVKVEAEDHFESSVVLFDTVHVDNFNPRVKITYPTNYYHNIEKYEKEVWCTFSEAMDTATLIPSNITIRSLVDTSNYYSIVSITYIDSLFKLVLEVDSFFFHDEVEVRLLDGIKDLAGKSHEQGHGKETCIAWTEVGTARKCAIMAHIGAHRCNTDNAS